MEAQVTIILTQEEVSSRLSKSRPAIANSLRLLNLPDSVQTMVKDGKLSAGHGRVLAGIKDEPATLRLANDAAINGWSVREVERKAAKIANPELAEIEKEAKKKQKEEQQMRDSIEVGDEITTIGGIVGRVVTVKDDSLIIETGAERNRIKIMRWAISTNNTANEKLEAERAAAKEAQEAEKAAKMEEAKAKSKASRKKSKKNKDADAE